MGYAVLRSPIPTESRSVTVLSLSAQGRDSPGDFSPFGDLMPIPEAERRRKPAPPPLTERLLDKHEVLAITGLSFPTIWSWMRAGRFPRSRIVGGKSMWLSSEVKGWLAGLPVRPLKGDAPDEVA
jgi:predicted DNA-binding transcriptional regulator AlpA